MTADIATVVGQLSIYGGKSRSKAPNQIAVREPKADDAPGAGKGDLYIITEIKGKVTNKDNLEQQLAQAILDTYYLSRGSITASLRRALQAGSDLLYYHNQNATPEKQIIGGSVVLVTNGKDAFVAQVGPTAFFAVLGDHIRRYPNQSVWLDGDDETTDKQTTSALGESSVIEPGLHHLRINANDKLVLADSRLAKALPLRELVHAVDPGNAKSAVKNLGTITRSPHASAIVVEVTTANTTGFGPLKISKPKISAPAQLGRLLKRNSTKPAAVAAPPVTAEATVEARAFEPAVQAQGQGATVFSSTSIMQKPMQWLGNLGSKATPAPTTAPPAYQEPADSIYQPDPTPAVHPVIEFDELEEAPEVTTYKSTDSDDLDDKPAGPAGFQKIMQGIGVGLFTLIALIGTGLKNILAMLLPGMNDELPKQAGIQAQQQQPVASIKLLRNIAIAIPIIVILIVVVSYLQKGRIREAEYTEHVTTAQQKFEQAQAVDVTSALGLMTEAETSLGLAEEIKQDQPEIVQLRQQMAEQADVIGNVNRLYYLPELRQYADTGTFAAQIVVHGLDLYVMDTGNDRIYHHQMDDLGEALLPDDQATVLMASRGQAVENITIDELLAMTWMPAGGNRQTSDLVIMNSTGLLEYSPNWGIAPSVLAGTEQLVRPTAVDSYFGNFYVLDAQANKLLRYLPTQDGYSLPPESYFANEQAANLTSAVDMTIDGAIYVLYQDGRIAKFLGGQPDTEFTITGLDIPFNNPVAIFTAPDEELLHIYVADAGNQRIVQLNKDGSFVRQFKPRLGETVSFANLQDIFVDEISNRIYILDSNNLYLSNIPAE